jgi:hypothetical protein
VKKRSSLQPEIPELSRDVEHLLSKASDRVWRHDLFLPEHPPLVPPMHNQLYTVNDKEKKRPDCLLMRPGRLETTSGLGGRPRVPYRCARRRLEGYPGARDMPGTVYAGKVTAKL